MNPKQFDPHLNPREIVLVGLGGTGAQWARSIARMVYALKRANRSAPQVKFIDPDRVEAHNVGRQLFTPADVGQYKAEVLARRFNYALGLDIAWFPEPLDTARHTVAYGTILCGAVDNHLARRELARHETVWIDAGNHASGGQVILGNSGDWSTVTRELDRDEPVCRYLPNAGLLFPELLQPEVTAVSEIGQGAGCSELVEAGVQDLLVNDFLAAIAAQVLYKLLNRQPIQTFVTYVDLDGLAMRSLPISLEHLEPYMADRLEALV